MCDPTGGAATIAVLSGGLGIAQSIGGYQQAQQNTAYANAQAEQQYQYQQQQQQYQERQQEQQYQYQQQQASAARNYEQLRYNQQQALMRQTRLLADNAYADEISQINLRLMQEQEASAQQKQKAAREGLQARGAVVAGGRIGNTIDALVADYQRQQAQFDYATERNLAFTTMQMQEAKRGSAATRGSRIASQQEYIKQEILDPLKPMKPMEPLKPMKQAAPSATPFILQGAGAALQAAGGVQSAFAKKK